MKLPSVPFLRHQSAVKAFESQDPSWRDIVFYSEGAADWPHLGPIVEALLRDHDPQISYLTSDPADPALAIRGARLRTFDIGSGTARTVLFARMQARRFVMTLPDLGNLWLKRSVHPVEYVYAFHSMNSTHTSYRTGAFDHFDTILCVGPHHVEEIRRTEEVYRLPAKRLVEHGSVKLDSLLAEIERHPPIPRGDGPLEVLVAPTWGESSLIERPIGLEVLSALLGAGFRTVLRLHPMTTRRRPELVRDVERAFGSDRRFALERDMNAIESWLRSDVMVSDWSGAATEFAFATMKPVIYMDLPPKISNPQWTRVGGTSFEWEVRREVGRVVGPSRVADLPAVIADAIGQEARTRGSIAAARSRRIFNVGKSASAAVPSLINP